MILSQLYANHPAFPKIRFHAGMNVIVGAANSGKTCLGELIDFLLLKDLRKESFLIKNKIFKPYVFYLEIILDNGQFCTIRRAVAHKKISFSLTADSVPPTASDRQWQYTSKDLDSARTYLNELLHYNVLTQYLYRNFLHFNIRSESQLLRKDRFCKFDKQKDIMWKPAILELLGYDPTLYLQKHALELKIQEAKASKSKLRKYLDDKRKCITSNISLDTAIKAYRKKKEQIDLSSIDQLVTDETVAEIEEKISALNIERDNLESDLKDLSERSHHDIEEVAYQQLVTLFAEVGIYFQDQLKNDFDSMIEMNKKITSSTKNNYSELIQKKTALLTDVNNQLAELALRKARNHKILENNQLFAKYDSINEKIISMEFQLAENQEKIAALDRLIAEDQEKESLRKPLEQLKNDLLFYFSAPSPLLSELKNTMIDLSRSLLSNTEAVVSVCSNLKGNPEFDIEVINSQFTLVSTDDGKTYKGFFTAILDLALAIYYSQYAYTHFLFHDGILDGTDIRIKERFPDKIRSICANHQLQYIFTSIEGEIADLLASGKISRADFCLVLSDESDGSGTLFGFNF